MVVTEDKRGREKMKSLIKTNCELCGKELERHPYRLKNGRK